MNRLLFSSKSVNSVFISILVEHLRSCRPISGSILQFWAWHCQIHVHDCLARSNVWSHATFCQVTKTISFGRWTPDFNLGRLRIFRGCGATANERIVAA